MDAFQWSMPFLAQKIMGILVYVVQKLADVPDDSTDMNNEPKKPGKAIATLNKNALAERIRKNNIMKAKI